MIQPVCTSIELKVDPNYQQAARLGKGGAKKLQLLERRLQSDVARRRAIEESVEYMDDDDIDTDFTSKGSRWALLWTRVRDCDLSCTERPAKRVLIVRSESVAHHCKSRLDAGPR